MSYKIQNLTEKGIERKVRRIFGENFPVDIVRNFVLVHQDNTTEEVRKERVASFTPEKYFDANCPHCAPFLNDGAYIVYTGESTYGLREISKTSMETVVFFANMPTRA